MTLHAPTPVSGPNRPAGSPVDLPPPFGGNGPPDADGSSSRPFDPPRPPPPLARPTRHRPNLFRPLLLASIVALVFAVCTPGSPVRSIGWVIALVVLMGALVVAAARRPAAIWLGLAGIAFIPWLGLRMSPWLVSVDLVAAVVLLLASLGLPPAGSLRVTVFHHLARLARTVGGLLSGPSHLLHDARRSIVASRTLGLRRWFAAVVVGAATTTGALAILASGDALLASFFDVGAFAGPAVVRCFAALCGVTAFAVLLGAIHVPGSSDAVPAMRAAPVLPTLFGLGGLSVAVGAYAAAQISATLLGADFVKSRTGLTYAEYARAGFFQMVVIAVVSVVAVGVARAAVRVEPGEAGKIRLGAATVTAGVVVTVVSAIVKLSIYADTFGLTMLRVYTVLFACWLGLIAVLAFVAVLRPASSWFAPVLLGTLCIGAFALNIADPERIVVEHNLDRAESTGKLDVAYLSRLSLDAAPTVFARLNSIDALDDDRSDGGIGSADAQATMRVVWCAKVAAGAGGGGLSFNVARANAVNAASGSCS